MRKTRFLLSAALFLVIGCSSATISQDSVISQLSYESSAASDMVSLNSESIEISPPEPVLDQSDFEEDILLEAREPSVTLPHSDRIEVYDPANPQLDYSMVPDQILDFHKEKGYIVYSYLYFAPPENIQLWNSWVESFIKGQPARLLLFYDAYGRPGSAYELIADGSDTYTIKHFTAQNQNTYQSSSLLSNDFEQIFAPELEGTKFRTIYTKPVEVAVLNHSIENGTELGTVSPQEAIEHAKQGIKKVSEQRSDHSGPPDPEWNVRIIGALSLYEHPCYVVKTSSPQYDPVWDAEVAINADGGNLLFMRDLDSNWFLIEDSNMKSISYTS